jgi:hypothetical protein
MAASFDLPLPAAADARVVVPPPGEGPGNWAGGPSAVLADDGTFWLAYRLRRPVGSGRGYANLVARSDDGERFETVLVLGRDDFGSESLERPALVALPDGRWRLYVSCATPGTDHWRVDVLEAEDPTQFDPVSAKTVLPGDPSSVAVKDPVVKLIGGRWHMWLCCHPLDRPEDTDRMTTRYGTSPDGLDWSLNGVALGPTPGSWDARGTRVADVWHRDGRWLAYYDGRATKAQNAEERTGIAVGDSPDSLSTIGVTVGAFDDGEGSLRYLSAVALPDGATRLYYETSLRDGAHDLRTEYVPPWR